MCRERRHSLVSVFQLPNCWRVLNSTVSVMLRVSSFQPALYVSKAVSLARADIWRLHRPAVGFHEFAAEDRERRGKRGRGERRRGRRAGGRIRVWKYAARNRFSPTVTHSALQIFSRATLQVSVSASRLVLPSSLCESEDPSGEEGQGRRSRESTQQADRSQQSQTCREWWRLRGWAGRGRSGAF